MTDKTTHANPSKNRTPRHRAREFALQGLYQWLLNNEPSSQVANNIRAAHGFDKADGCLLYTSPSPRDRQKSRMPSSA